MMFGLLQKVPVHLKIYPDEIEITDLRNGHTIRRAAIQKFSSPRMLVAEFYLTEALAKSILTDLGIGGRVLKIAVQQMVDLGGGITNTEQRHLRDLCEHIGAADSIILLHTRAVPATEVMRLLGMKAEELPVDVTW